MVGLTEQRLGSVLWLAVRLRRSITARSQVQTADGAVADRLVLSGDFVHLSHNAGVAACGDRLAVLGLRSQTIKLLQVALLMLLFALLHSLELVLPFLMCSQSCS